jgi:lipopolysaccharide/colanic/teichoic acid biosynthesis glycosyltransferase
LPFIAVLIKLMSRGPVSSSRRKDRKGFRSFTIYKLRTMQDDADKKKGYYHQRGQPGYDI